MPPLLRQVYGEGHPFGDPAWYQAYNTPYYKDLALCFSCAEKEVSRSRGVVKGVQSVPSQQKLPGNLPQQVRISRAVEATKSEHHCH